MHNSKNTGGFLFGLLFLACVVPSVVAQADAPAPSTAAVLIGDHADFPIADAQTAAMLVYNELRKYGISATKPVFEVPASASVYRIEMRPLGTKIFVRLSEESPIGTIKAERQIMLAGIEEMISAAPRLVDALVHDKPIASTVGMTTVTEEEARVLRKVTGEHHFNIGFFGAFTPAQMSTASLAIALVGLTSFHRMLWKLEDGLFQTKVTDSPLFRPVDCSFSTNRPLLPL